MDPIPPGTVILPPGVIHYGTDLMYNKSAFYLTEFSKPGKVKSFQLIYNRIVTRGERAWSG
jgi:hypothetical protein